MRKRKTDAEFKQQVYDLVGNEYVFLDSYVNATTKIRVKHEKCNNIYEVQPCAFLRGRRCPYCSKARSKVRRKPNAQFKQEVKNLVGSEYTFLDAYVNARTKLGVKHNKCGNIYEVLPNSFLHDNRCPYCSSRARGRARRKTDAQFKQEVKNLVGDEYTFLEPYVNAGTKIRVKHNNCGNIYKIKPNNFLGGRRCSYCSSRAKGKAQRKTNVQFKQEVYDLVGNEYTFLDPYVDGKTKLRVRHNQCGHIYKVRPCNFLGGRRCSYCSSKAKRKTDEQFKKEVFDLVGDEYIFLDAYVYSKTKLRVKHNKCGNVYKVIPNNFLNIGNRCPYCSSNAGKTNAQFKQEVYDLVGNEYVFLESYINSSTKIEVKHNKCGNTYKVKPSRFLIGDRCPYCAGLAKKTDVQFKKEVFDLVGDEYVFLESYVNSSTKIKVKHNKCGKVYEVTPNNFLNIGSRCLFCSGSLKKTDEQFKQEVKNLVGDEYIFLDSYVNTDTKIKVKHNQCGNVYKVRPCNFLQGSRCTYCNRRPKGEVLINRILKSLKIKYEYQKTFDDLKDKSYLSYDFYIPDQNILIEYQGMQHYQPVDYFGGEAQFKTQQKHDKMKSDYAKGNSYKLIAVPYTEDTFSKIKKYLVKHGLEQHLTSTPKRDASFHFTFA